MSEPQESRIALYYTEGSSDKEYRVELRKVGALWMTLGFNGRRGQALKEQKKTPVPVDYAVAKAVYDSTMAEKIKKGYTTAESGAVYQSLPSDKAFSGFVPQLLNAVREDSVLEELLCDDRVCAQEKHDGERRPIRVRGTTVEGINKEGLVTSLPMNVVADIQSLAVDVLLDGEILGERYVVFDLLEHDGLDLRTLPYQKRFAVLQQLCAHLPASAQVTVTSHAETEADKRALLAYLLEHKAEGVVFKQMDALYAPGRPASGGSQRKYKFTEVCSVRVASQNARKRSVGLECLDETGQAQNIGNVAIPVNADIPAVGAIVNVGYLYAYPNGSLYQPIYHGVRFDQQLPDCRTQLKFKAGAVAAPPPKRNRKKP